MREIGQMICIMERVNQIDKMDKFIQENLVKVYFMEMENNYGLMEIHMKVNLLIPNDMVKVK